MRAFLKSSGLYHRVFVKKLHNGTLMRLRPSEHVQQQIFWYGYYEKQAILIWEKFIQADAIVLDIGAHTGYYSLIAASKAGAVYAFEPSASNVEELNNNIQLNKFTNIHSQPIAIGAQSGTARLFVSSDDNRGMTSLKQPENFSGLTEETRIITLDQWVKTHSLSRIDCIKIDVEGAEMQVLSGAIQSLRQYKPVVFIEIIDALLSKFGHSSEDIFQLFWSMGYTAYEIVEAGLLRPLTEPKEADTIIFLPPGFILPADITLENGRD